MTYSKAQYKANTKYDKAHYNQVHVKIPFTVYDKMIQCKEYSNNNQFINLLIRNQIENENSSQDLESN